MCIKAKSSESLANVFASSAVAAFGGCVEFQASAAGVSELGDCCPDGQSADSSVNQLSGLNGSDVEKAFVCFFS